jgi:hypothetical protein
MCEGSRFDSRQRQDVYIFSKASTPAPVAAQLLIQWVPGFFFPPGIQRVGRKADRLRPFSAED